MTSISNIELYMVDTHQNGGSYDHQDGGIINFE